MALLNLHPRQAGDTDTDVVSLELRRIEAARRNIRDKVADVVEVLGHNDRDQVEREIADIESATAALIKGEPALRSGVLPAAQRPEAAPTANPRSVWMLISALWLSTAIVAAGAVAAIITIVG